jgi:Cof subfamily protein (haloacid dehalogenase superfamily)
MDAPEDAGGRANGSERLLVALDVDGTLIDTEHDEEMRPRVAAAIRAVLAAGHLCAPCTGRNRLSVEAILQNAGPDLSALPLVLLNGALVIGGTPRRQLCHRVLARPLLRRLVEIFRDHGVLPMIYDAEERGGVLYHEEGPVNPVLALYLDRRRRHEGACRALPDLLEALPQTALEVGTIDTTDRVRPLSRHVRDELGERVNLINTRTLLASDTHVWAEVYEGSCSKGQGILLLAREYGVPARNIIAIGDNTNDLDLFAAAACSIAMGNAPAEVQAAADRVAPPVSASGAAVVLEEIAAGGYPLQTG